MVAIFVASMNFENFISQQKHPEPVKERVLDIGSAGKEKLIGREKVLKLFKKTRPKSADEYLLSYGL